MRAKFNRAFLLVVAAGATAVAFALAAAPHGPSEADSGPLRMPAETGRTVVELRPAPGRPESSPGPIVPSPAVPARPQRPEPAAPAPPRPRHRARVVVVPGVILTRVQPTTPKVKVIPVRKNRPPARPARELAQLEAELAAVHDRPAPPRPHE